MKLPVLIGVAMIATGLALAGYIVYSIRESNYGPKRVTNTPDHLNAILRRLDDEKEWEDD